MWTVGFNMKSGIPVNRKEVISKRDQLAQLILIQIPIVNKGLRLIPS